jgi:hypothetical protein
MKDSKKRAVGPKWPYAAHRGAVRRKGGFEKYYIEYKIHNLAITIIIL